MNQPGNQHEIAALFVKYLEHRCTAEEIRTLLDHFEIRENEELLRGMISAEIRSDADNTQAGQLTERAVAQVRSSLLKKIRAQKTGQQKQAWLFNLPVWIRISAFWLLLTGAAITLYHHFKPFIGSDMKQPRYRSLVTGPGERRKIRLADGTVIWLAPSGRLEYPQAFTGELREVRLSGEAFFEVARDKQHPFIIHSDRMDTRVVGTSFTIQSAQGAKVAKVTVVTGIVTVSATGGTFPDKSKQVILRPHQQSIFNKDDGSLAGIEYPDAMQMLKRKDGILNYNAVPVRQVLAEISGYYNRNIALSKPADNCLFTGELDCNRPLEIVLNQLAATINAVVIVQKDKYILKGGCDD